MKETMDCPSKRLITKVKKIYFGENLQKSQFSHKTLHLTSTLYMNQEPIIFQVSNEKFVVSNINSINNKLITSQNDFIFI